MRESAKKRYKVGCLRSLRGWPSIGGPEPSVYIEPQGGKLWKGGQLVSDFELLSIVLMILAIIVTLMVELFKSMKK